jgi:alkylhydroperoxidase family enzyme
MAMAQGFSREEVKNIIADIEGSALIDDKTKTLLHFSEKITRESFKIHVETIQELRNQGCSDEEIFEAVAVTSLFNYMDRMADALGAPVEGFQDMIESMGA